MGGVADGGGPVVAELFRRWAPPEQCSATGIEEEAGEEGEKTKTEKVEAETEEEKKGQDAELTKELAQERGIGKLPGASAPGQRTDKLAVEDWQRVLASRELQVAQ